MCNYGKSNILALFGYWCLLGERTPWLRHRPPAEGCRLRGKGASGWGEGVVAEGLGKRQRGSGAIVGGGVGVEMESFAIQVRSGGEEIRQAGGGIERRR